MAKDLTPDAWLTSTTYTSSTLHIPKAAITGLTDAMCDTVTTGDIRAILMLLLSQLKTHQDGLATGDKPAEMTIAETASTSQRLFTVRFLGAQTAFTLAAEP